MKQQIHWETVFSEPLQLKWLYTAPIFCLDHTLEWPDLAHHGEQKAHWILTRASNPKNTPVALLASGLGPLMYWLPKLNVKQLFFFVTSHYLFVFFCHICSFYFPVSAHGPNVASLLVCMLYLAQLKNWAYVCVADLAHLNFLFFPLSLFLFEFAFGLSRVLFRVFL